jgi:hypothetical protein
MIRSHNNILIKQSLLSHHLDKIIYMHFSNPTKHELIYHESALENSEADRNTSTRQYLL